MNSKNKTLFGYIILWIAFTPMLVAGNILLNSPVDTTSSNIEVFTFISNGQEMKGKIYLPDSYKASLDLPAIYLIDFTEQHFKLATDEFERVIDGVNKLNGFEALVVSLDGIPDIDAEPDNFEQHYSIFKDLTSYVDSTYTKNTSRTFIGKGSESGVVLMALFLEDVENPIFNNFIVTDPSPQYTLAIVDIIEKDTFSKNKSDLKLHLSFSISNNRELCIKLIKLIDQTQYEWLKFESVEYTKSNYENTYPISYAEGIRYVFIE